MDSQQLTNLLIGLVGPGAIGLIVVAFIKLRENRTTLKYGYEQNEAAIQGQWNARYRAAAEKHLPWDADMRTGLLEVRYEVNLLRQEGGKQPRDWTPIPPAPPLFPDLSQEAPRD